MIGMHELPFCDDIPLIIAMNKSMAIRKIMSTAESGQSLDGLLDNVKKR
jgi:transcription termination factor NusB